MSANPLPRPTIRCNKCGLNQFDRPTCRKCGKVPHKEPISLIPKPKPALLVLDTIGYRVRKYRLREHITQKQLSRRMGLKARSYFSRVELDLCEPTVDQIVRIAEALRINPARLIPPQGPSLEETLWQVREMVPLLTEAQKYELLAFAAELTEKCHIAVNSTAANDGR